MNEANFSVPTMRAALRRCGGELASSAFFSLFINVLMLTFPLYMLQIFTRVLSSQSVETLIFLTLAAIAALILYGTLTALRARILVRMSAKLDTLLGERVHAALISRSLTTNDPRNVQALRDLSLVRNFLGGSDIHSLFDVPWTPIFLAVIFLLDPMLGAVAAGGAVVLFVFAVVNDLRSRNPLNVANAAAQNAYRHANANVRNAEVIEGMGMSKAAMTHWRQQNAMALEFQNLAVDRSGTISAASKTLRLILQILVFAVGAFLVIEQKASPGVMIASVILMGRALSPVDAAIRTWKNLLGARAAYRRLEVLLKRVPPRRSSMTLPAPKGRLTAEQLVYIPPGSDKPILRAVSFVLNPGESLGIVGPSAAGKSSLAKLIVGVWDPTRGHIRLDGADVATWDSDDLGQYVGYLPQEVELFGGTIRENIARMSDAPSEDIVAAARLAGVHEMILDLPDGYETQIGEGGSILSGGQRQRVALARALFGQPRLLVLDEPNANIDQEGEEALANALAEAKAGGTTSVIIAHRPIVLSKVDKILVLRNGRVEMFGPRDEIIGKIMPGAVRPRIVASDA